MSSSLSEERALKDRLNDTGNNLLKPSNPVDALLNLLDQAEHLLVRVHQCPFESMEIALLLIVNALIAQPLLKHPNEDVKVYVASYISEVIRVTTPDQPYEDEDMKEVLELTVIALEKLSLGSGRGYSKDVSILHNLAIFRSCVLMLDLKCNNLIVDVLMLDLKCNNLIVDMIKLFIGITGLNHPDSVFCDMETVITIVIDKSDEIMLELLIPIARSINMENQNDSSLRWKLGENVCRCAPKIQPYLPRVAELMNEDLNDIIRVVFPVLPDVS